MIKGCQSSCSAYMLVYRLRSLSAGLYSVDSMVGAHVVEPSEVWLYSD